MSSGTRSGKRSRQKPVERYSGSPDPGRFRSRPGLFGFALFSEAGIRSTGYYEVIGGSPRMPEQEMIVLHPAREDFRLPVSHTSREGIGAGLPAPRYPGSEKPGFWRLPSGFCFFRVSISRCGTFFLRGEPASTSGEPPKAAIGHSIQEHQPLTGIIGTPIIFFFHEPPSLSLSSIPWTMVSRTVTRE